MTEVGGTHNTHLRQRCGTPELWFCHFSSPATASVREVTTLRSDSPLPEQMGGNSVSFPLCLPLRKILVQNFLFEPVWDKNRPIRDPGRRKQKFISAETPSESSGVPVFVECCFSPSWPWNLRKPSTEISKIQMTKLTCNGRAVPSCTLCLRSGRVLQTRTPLCLVKGRGSCPDHGTKKATNLLKGAGTFFLKQLSLQPLLYFHSTTTEHVTLPHHRCFPPAGVSSQGRDFITSASLALIPPLTQLVLLENLLTQREAHCTHRISRSKQDKPLLLQRPGSRSTQETASNSHPPLPAPPAPPAFTFPTASAPQRPTSLLPAGPKTAAVQLPLSRAGLLQLRFLIRAGEPWTAATAPACLREKQPCLAPPRLSAFAHPATDTSSVRLRNGSHARGGAFHSHKHTRTPTPRRQVQSALFISASPDTDRLQPAGTGLELAAAAREARRHGAVTLTA